MQLYDHKKESNFYPILLCFFNANITFFQSKQYFIKKNNLKYYNTYELIKINCNKLRNN